MFAQCEICGRNSWQTIYHGPVRDGTFGDSLSEGTVARCTGCGVERLAECHCPPDSSYESEEYRAKLKQGLDAPSYLKLHDEFQIFTLSQIWPKNLRGQTIADIGCAGGSFLDHINGLSDRLVAVEPCSIYHEDLNKRGYAVYPYARDATADLAGQVDLAVSLQVIEHTRNPREFLEDIRPLLKRSGLLVISTPNRDDILNTLLPTDFGSFFYRVVHRWYFDRQSLDECARMAGYQVLESRHVHRYGMSNALAWLRDRKPTGQWRLDGISPLADALWRGYLEETGQADTVYSFLAPV
jgi:SAM-dependent methyltransferase